MKKKYKIILLVSIVLLVLSLYYCYEIINNKLEYKIITNAINDNDIFKLEKVLKNGANPNASNVTSNNGIFESLTDSKHTRFTALQYAAFIGNDRAIKMLLDYGADPNYCPKSVLYSALARAVMNENIDIKLSTIKLLVEAGADVNFSSNQNRYVLDWVINNYSPNNQYGYNDAEIFKYLVEMGADVYAKDYLLLACKMGKGDIIKYLINECDYTLNGEKELLEYCEAVVSLSQAPFDTETFSCFLENGADINRIAKNGMSVSDYLINTGHEEWLVQQ